MNDQSWGDASSSSRQGKIIIINVFVIWFKCCNDNLTLWRLTTYVYVVPQANLQKLHFKYLLNKYTY